MSAKDAIDADLKDKIAINAARLRWLMPQLVNAKTALISNTRRLFQSSIKSFFYVCMPYDRV